MLEELWWLWAILAGFATGAVIYANQIIKMPSSLMMCYRGVLMCLMLTPFAFFFDLPSNPWFWVLGIIQGLLISYVDKKTFLCSRIYGGEITASIKPFVIAFVFIFWWLIKPSQLFEMLETPTTFGLTILCMTGITISLWLIRRKAISKEAFILLLPALCFSVIIDANNKNITTIGAKDSLASAVFWYSWLTALFAGIPNMIKFLQNRDWHLIFAPKYMLGGVIVVIFNLAGNVLKNVSMYYAKNPAYVSAIIALYPIWIIIWNIFYYRKQNREKFPHCEFSAIILLLASIILLILIQ